MLEANLKPGWDTILFSVPFLGMLMIGFFRLDTIFAAPRQDGKARRPAAGVDEDGHPILSDPDGRTWRVTPGRK